MQGYAGSCWFVLGLYARYSVHGPTRCRLLGAEMRLNGEYRSKRKNNDTWLRGSHPYDVCVGWLVLKLPVYWNVTVKYVRTKLMLAITLIYNEKWHARNSYFIKHSNRNHSFWLGSTVNLTNGRKLLHSKGLLEDVWAWSLSSIVQLSLCIVLWFVVPARSTPIECLPNLNHIFLNFKGSKT
jgi:hypothetical protein